MPGGAALGGGCYDRFGQGLILAIPLAACARRFLALLSCNGAREQWK
jgi:hypothetical protein